MAPDTSTVCVFAPSLLVTVTIESGLDEFDEMHFHMGGQGYWVARMVKELGERPILCAPVGGETGQVVRGLVGSTRIDFSPVNVVNSSPGYVHDRREGKRVEVATARSPELDRHETDDLFARTLQHAISAGFCVLTGRREGDTIPADFYRRLAADFGAAGVQTVGDLHGEELEAVLAGGPIDVLKVSDEDLVDDGLLSDVDVPDDDVWKAIDGLVGRGAKAVVVSRGSHGAIASFGERRIRASPPELEVVDSAGAGDSMTAALTVSLIRDSDPVEAMRLASAAGAANVTRHGLGSSPVDLIYRLAPLVDIEEHG